MRTCLVIVALAVAVQAGTQPADERRNQQAVIETSAGTIVLDLLADRAPNHVALFLKTARAGGYDGTTFHRVVRQGIIQGGDPLTKDPAATARYGTGGLNLLKAEINPEKHTRGAVSAVLIPNRPDSAGTQFFICIIDQPALDGQYTVFAKVVEGIMVAQKISEAAADGKGAPVDRIEMKKVTIRDKPAETAAPFSTESVSELAGYRAVLETSMGDIAIELTPEKAPEHVRNFLRLASTGVYDGTSWHRVVKGFVIQTGHMPTRREPLGESQHEVGQGSEGRVQRPAARAWHRLHGTAGGARHGEHVVLHRHRARADARSQIHGVRQSGRRHRCGAEDRGRRRER